MRIHERQSAAAAWTLTREAALKRGRVRIRRWHATRRRERGWQNSTQRKNTKESQAARITAIGRESQEALGKYEGTLFHAISGQTLEIEISTARTVRESQERPRYARGVEALIAGVAAPGTKSHGASQMIDYT